jgi:hypothetical protein
MKINLESISLLGEIRIGSGEGSLEVVRCFSFHFKPSWT